VAKVKKSKRVEIVETKPVVPMLFIARMILLCAVIFLAPLVAGRLVPAQDISIQLLVLLSAVLWLADAGKRGSIGLPGGRIAAYAAVFMALLLVSSIGSASLHATLRELVNFLCYLLIFFIVADLRGRPRAIYSMVAALLLSALVVGALGVREYRLSVGGGWRVFSTFFNPDFTAGFLALALPMAVAWYLSATSFGVSAVAFLSILFSAGCLVMTGSRFGFAGAAVGIVVFFIFALLSRSIRRPQFVRLAILFLPALAMCVVLGKPLMNRMASKSMHDERHSMDFRTYTWIGTMRMAKANPVKGTGLGTFEVAYPPYGIVAYTKMAHNSYLQIAGEAGPLAAAALIVLLASAAIPSAVGAIRRRSNPCSESEPGADEFVWTPETGLLLSGLIGGVSASMARNLVDSDWYITAIGLTFWAVLGAVVALAYPKEKREIAFTAPMFSVAGGVLLAISIGAAFMLAGAGYQADGESLADTGDANGAAASYQQAASLDPLNAQPHLTLGELEIAIARGSGDSSYVDRAAGEFKSAIRLEPASSKNYYQLYKANDFLGRNDEAMAAIRSAVARDPKSPVLLDAMARLCEKMGRHSEMLSVYREMERIEESPYEQVRAVTELVEPTYVFAHVALGDELLRTGDSVGAREEYVRAMDRIDRYKASLKAMAAILAAGGRQDPSMEDRIDRTRKELLPKLK
jgi:O-antigen ligase/tetratricopeptide (TPR) repeat protein